LPFNVFGSGTCQKGRFLAVSHFPSLTPKFFTLSHVGRLRRVSGLSKASIRSLMGQPMPLIVPAVRSQFWAKIR
jgi:hypothetical protein